MLQKKNLRYENGLLVKEKYYLGKLCVLKRTIDYKKYDTQTTTYLFGIPLYKESTKIGSKLLYKCHIQESKYNHTLDANHYMSQDIANATTQNNLHDRLERLCKNLDPQSIEVVSRIINRLKLTTLSKDKSYTGVSKEEHKALENLRDNYLTNIIKLDENLYFYNGYFIPKNPLYEASVWLYEHNMNLFSTLNKIKNKNVIDVGGYIGDSAIIFEKYTDKNIYCFEPVSDNYKLVKETIKLNNATKIIPINKGLGSKKESLSIMKNGASSTINNTDSSIKNKEKEQISITTLDSFVEENNIEVGFIKVDTEGFEMEFLKGALETIKSQKPAMLLSIYHSADDFFGIKPFIESLNLGYSFTIHKPIDFTISGECALYCEVRN